MENSLSGSFYKSSRSFTAGKSSELFNEPMIINEEDCMVGNAGFLDTLCGQPSYNSLYGVHGRQERRYL